MSTRIARRTAQWGDFLDAKRLTRAALLAVIALIIFTVEAQIPNPFPIYGVKLGLANVVTVYAVYTLSGREAVLILLTRILIAGMFSANGMALIFSLSGGMLCIVGMLLLRRVISERDMWLASVCGAVLHNLGQLIAAAAVTRSFSVFWYAPFLLLSGCLAGAFTGAIAQLIIKRYKKRK